MKKVLCLAATLFAATFNAFADEPAPKQTWVETGSAADDTKTLGVDDNSAEVPCGTEVTLTATPLTGYTLKEFQEWDKTESSQTTHTEWVKGGSAVTEVNNVFTLKFDIDQANYDHIFKAIFTARLNKIIVCDKNYNIADPSVDGSVERGTYKYKILPDGEATDYSLTDEIFATDAKVEITATCKDLCYEFHHWEDKDGNTLSTNEDITVEGSKLTFKVQSSFNVSGTLLDVNPNTYKAVYKQKTFQVKVKTGGNGTIKIAY